MRVVLAAFLIAAAVPATAQEPSAATPRVAGGQRPADAPPPGYLPPPLNPTGVTLETRKLSDGVYALVANTPFTDNAGFVVGTDAVLVIDSQFNGRMGRQVIDAVRRVTDRPITYLLNTNAFGDHVFGNYVFPADTRIVANRRTLEALKATSAAEIGRRMAATVDNDPSVFEGVQLRVPDEGFEETWSVDLGGRKVEARFFGPGMSPNDTVVFVPDAAVAWTGNLVFGEGTLAWAQSGNLAAFRQTLQKMSRSITVRTIVPGHGAITTGEIVGVYDRYLAEVQQAAADAVRQGTPMQALVAEARVPSTYRIAPSLVPLMTGFHRWNLQRAYAEAAAASK